MDGFDMKYIIYAVFSFFIITNIQFVIAAKKNPVAHKHGNRGHSHVLPAQGLGHNHRSTETTPAALPIVKGKVFPVLILEEKMNNKIINKLEFMSNKISPNTSSINDRFQIRLNQKIISIPKKFFSILDYSRRSFSYDALSKGIRVRKNKARCMMRGSSNGLVLSTRYLTYKNSRIASHEMKPVYSVAKNCLFNTFYSPNSQSSKEDAGRILGIMEAIIIFSKR